MPCSKGFKSILNKKNDKLVTAKEQQWMWNRSSDK